MQKRIIIALLLLGCLGLGFVAGTIFSHRKFMEMLDGGPERLPKMISMRLAHNLNLSSEQKEQIKPVVRNLHQKLIALRQGVAPQLQVILSETQAEMKPLLTSEQQKELKQLHEKLLRRIRSAAQKIETVSQAGSDTPY